MPGCRDADRDEHADADADVDADFDFGMDFAWDVSESWDGNDLCEDRVGESDSSADDAGAECVDMDGDGYGSGCLAGDDCDDASELCTTDCTDSDRNGIPDCRDSPGHGVFLYTGAGGGTPGTDMYVGDVYDVYSNAETSVEKGEILPTDFLERFGTLVFMNPLEEIPQEVKASAMHLVGRGGRVVIIMEHCKIGCWGNEDEDNRLLRDLGSTMSLSGVGGGPLSDTTLSVTPTPPLTNGVSSLVVYYIGSVDVGGGIPLGYIEGGDTVIGYEKVSKGDVVAVADSSMFGYVMDMGDNIRFILNFADLL